MKNLLTVELDDHIFKLLYAHPKSSGWKVNNLEAENITGKTEEDIVNLIKNRLRKLKIKLSPAILVVPRSVVTVRYLQLPTADLNELKNMVDIQVVRQIPYSRPEMVYDYTVLGSTEKEYTNVLLVIVHKDVISKYIRILEKAGISPIAVELDTLAIAKEIKFVNSIQKDKDKKIVLDSSLAIIDIDYSATNIMVLQKEGLPIFTRSISIGSMHLEGKLVHPGGKDWTGEWINETNRSLEVYQRDNAVKLQKILVSGDTNKKVISLMNERFGVNVSSCDISSLVEGVALTTGSIKLNGLTISVSGLLGAIREGIATTVNLIPESIQSARFSTQRKKSLMVTSLLLIGIFGISGFTINKKIQDRRSYMDVIERRLEETNPLANDLEIKRERLALIRDQLSMEGTSLDILKELYTIIPDKTTLTAFSYDDRRGVIIKGLAPAMSEVFGLIPKLEGSPLFRSVTPRDTTQRKIKGKELTDFHIDCSLEVNREAR